MAEDNDPKEPQGTEVRPEVSHRFLISYLMWSIVIVPLSVGVFFILEFFPKLTTEVFPDMTNLGNQYSAVLGLFVGLLVSAIVGYIYAKRAGKAVQ